MYKFRGQKDAAPFSFMVAAFVLVFSGVSNHARATDCFAMENARPDDPCPFGGVAGATVYEARSPWLGAIYNEYSNPPDAVITVDITNPGCDPMPYTAAGHAVTFTESYSVSGGGEWGGSIQATASALVASATAAAHAAVTYNNTRTNSISVTVAGGISFVVPRCQTWTYELRLPRHNARVWRMYADAYVSCESGWVADDDYWFDYRWCGLRELSATADGHSDRASETYHVGGVNEACEEACREFEENPETPGGGGGGPGDDPEDEIDGGVIPCLSDLIDVYDYSGGDTGVFVSEGLFDGLGSGGEDDECDDDLLIMPGDDWLIGIW